MNIIVADGGQSAQNLLANTPITPVGATVIRTVIDLQLTSITVAGAWGVAHANWGIGVESLEAFNGGTHPDPATPLDAPTRGWVHRGSLVSFQNGAGAPVVSRTTADNRAMRKLDRGVYVMVLDHAVVAGTSFAVRMSGLVRTLILLP